MSNGVSRKYCGPKLVKRIGNLTNKCYMQSLRKALNKHGLYDDSLSKRDLEVRFLLRLRLVTEDHTELGYLKKEIDQTYLDKLCSLSSKEIDDILWVHFCSKIRRATRTVETLLNELAGRSLLNDTKEKKRRKRKKR